MSAVATTIPVRWAGSLFGAYRGDVYREVMPAGLSIAEIVARVPRLPEGFDQHGIVCINGDPIDRRHWHRVRPRVDGPVPVSVTLHVPAGKGGNGRRILGIIAAIALIAFTGWIGAGGLVASGIATAGGAFASGAIGARLLAAGVGIIGSLAISALSPPPAAQAQGATPSTPDPKDIASASGNVLSKDSTLPAVVGTFRVYPSYLVEPRVRIVGDDTRVSVVLGLAGPHKLEDIQIDGVPIADAEDVTVETREGWDGDAPLSLVTAQTVTTAPAFSSLTGHQWGAASIAPWSHYFDLKDVANPENSLPVWQRVVSGRAPDAIECHLGWPQGLAIDGYTSSGHPGALQPIRMRFRLKGSSTWTNAPELMFFSAKSDQFQKAVILRWAAAPTPIPTPSVDITAGPRPIMLRLTTPDQTAAPASPGWAADSWFDAGSGDVYLGPGSSVGSAFNPSTTRLQNIALYDDRVEFYLDEGTFPKGIYEVEFKRGATVPDQTFTMSAYLYGLSQPDLFAYATNASDSHPVAPRETEQQVDTVTLTRVVSLWEQAPVQGSGLALIAIEATNREIAQVSVLASGYVQDWDGSAWATWTTTSNPAPHFRNILAGRLNRKALAPAQIDDESILAWRSACIAKGYSVNGILDGKSVGDGLNLLAGCGYAKPFKSEKWGVARDYDRTGESPVQVFSTRNMAGFTAAKAFPDLPDHLIATYYDASNEYAPTEVVIYADGVAEADAVLPESVDYLGLVTEADVIQRGTFDLRQSRLRSAVFSGTVSVENIVCRRGDFVGLEHDVLQRQAGAARVRAVLLTGGDVTGLVLDGTIPVGVDSDGETVAGSTGCAIRLKDGTVLVKRLVSVAAEVSTVTFVTPFADPGDILDEDCLVVSGQLGHEYRRVIVSDITPGEDVTAQMSFVDVADELWLKNLLSARATIEIDALQTEGYPLSAAATIDIDATVETTVTPAVSFTFVSSRTGAGGTITMPAGIAAGDVCIILDIASQGSIPPTIVPAGFTQLQNDSSSANAKGIMSAKILVGTETTVTGMTNASWIAMVFRPSSPVSAFTYNSGHGQVATGNPASQTIAAGGATTPVILFGQMASTAAISPRSTSPAMTEVASGTSFYGLYTIYNPGQTPVDTTFDMDDEGTWNILQSGYLSFTTRIRLPASLVVATEYPPSVSTGAAVLLRTNTVRATEYPPTIQAGYAGGAVPTDTVVATEFAPAIATGAALAVPAALAEATEYAPAIAGGASIMLPTSEAEAEEFAPAVASGGGGVLPADEVIAEEFAPTIQAGVNIVVPTSEAIATEYPPIVGLLVVIELPTTEAIAEEFAPTVATGASVVLPASEAVATEFPPTVDAVNSGFDAGFSAGFGAPEE